MPIKYSQAVREDVATRLSGGQTPKQISETLNLSLKTVYRLKKSFILDGSAYIAPPMGKTVREKINREKLIQLSEIMHRNANTTLKELMAQAVVEKVFESTETAPDISTLHRALTNKVGFKWQAPKYDDPRAARTRVTYERCEFRRSLQEGLVDSTKTLCMDETSFYVGGEAPTRAWGTTYKNPNIEKNKMGGIKVVMYLTIGYRLDGAGKPLAFIHWLCVPPQRSNKPLTDRIENWESEEKLESLKLKETLTEAYINSLTAAGLKKELQTLGLRSSSLNAETMREVLIRVGRQGRVLVNCERGKWAVQSSGCYARIHPRHTIFPSIYTNAWVHSLPATASGQREKRSASCLRTWASVNVSTLESGSMLLF